MIQEVIRVICASLGTLGFALLFRTKPKHLALATLGGTLSWVAYVAAGEAGAGVFLCPMAGGFVVCLWSEGMARLRKAPANVFLIPGIVPLLPGSALYYAMEGAINKNMAVFADKGIEALLGAVGIAGGILIASEIVRILLMAGYLRRKRLRKKEEAARRGAQAAQAEAQARELRGERD